MLRPCFFWRSHTLQHCVFPFGLLRLVYLHCLTWSIWFHSANAALPPHPRLQICYPPSAHLLSPPSAPSSPPHVPGCFSIPHAFSFPLTRSGFFNEMLEVHCISSLNCCTLSRLNLFTLSVFKNSTLTHLPLSGFLDSMLFHLIALTPGLAFFLCMTRTLMVASSFWSGNAYRSLNFHLLSIYA